jgi:hypothetical protein
VAGVSGCLLRQIMICGRVSGILVRRRHYFEDFPIVLNVLEGSGGGEGEGECQNQGQWDQQYGVKGNRG